MSRLNALIARYQGAVGNTNYLKTNLSTLSLEEEGQLDFPRPKSILLRDKKGRLYFAYRTDETYVLPNGQQFKEIFVFTIEGKAILLKLFIDNDGKEDRKTNCIAHVVLNPEEKIWFEPQGKTSVKIKDDTPNGKSDNTLIPNVEHVVAALISAGAKRLETAQYLKCVQKLAKENEEYPSNCLQIGDWVFFRASKKYVDAHPENIKIKIGVYIHGAVCSSLKPLMFSSKNGEEPLKDERLGRLMEEYHATINDLEFYRVQRVQTFPVSSPNSAEEQSKRQVNNLFKGEAVSEPLNDKTLAEAIAIVEAKVKPLAEQHKKQLDNFRAKEDKLKQFQMHQPTILKDQLDKVLRPALMPLLQANPKLLEDLMTRALKQLLDID